MWDHVVTVLPSAIFCFNRASGGSSSSLIYVQNMTQPFSPWSSLLITIHSLQKKKNRSLGNIINVIEYTYTRLIETSFTAVKGRIDLLVDW